mgnify:CR=1 FL=1
MKTPLKIIFLTIILLSFTGGCSTNPATGNKSFTAFMSKEKEIRVGAEEHPKILKKFGGEYTHGSLNSYIRVLGKKLASSSDIPDLPYRFIVLDDPKVNAFALPGGYVYITRGLLALANNEAEVAGVIAHEIGHITARHSAQRYSTSIATNIGLNIFGVLGSAAGVPTGLGEVVSFGADAAIQAYSRSQELEADMLAIRYMSRAGYSPTALISFFKSLNSHSKLLSKQKGEKAVRHGIMSTHPRTKDRITEAIRISKTKIPQNPVIGRTRYLTEINGIVFGDNLKHGIIQGQTFSHPNLRFSFTAPPNYTLINSPNKVTAIGPNKDRIEFSMVVLNKKSRFGSLESYLVNSWGKNIELGEIETISINGLVAKTTTGKILNGRLLVRLLVIQGAPWELFRFAFVTPVNPSKTVLTGMQRTTYSFRRLSWKEAKRIRPLRLKIKTIGANDSFATLSNEMKGSNRKFIHDWFVLLNNLKTPITLKEGAKIKIIGH